MQHDPGGSAQVEQYMGIDAVSLVCRGTVESTSAALLASAVPLRSLASGSGRVDSACFPAFRRSLGRQRLRQPPLIGFSDLVGPPLCLRQDMGCFCGLVYVSG